MENNSRTLKQKVFLGLSRMDLVLVILLAIITGLYVFLMIKDIVPPIGFMIIGSLWLLYWILGGRFSYATPIDLPVIGILLLTPINLAISVEKNLTLEKIYGLILSVVIFYWIVNFLRGIPRLWFVILVLIALATAIPILGLIGADWSGSNFTLPSRIAAALTSRFGFLDRLTSGGGIHVNTIGGTLSFFVPLLLGLFLDGGAFKQASFFKQQPINSLIIVYKIILVIVLILVLFVLFLTQSRGSYLGSGIGVLALLVWKDRRFLWLIPILFVGLILVFAIFANGNPSEFFALLDTEQDKNTLQVRLNYWERTIYLIQDFPFTGAGLGTYNNIFQQLYLFNPFTTEAETSFYAHNLYLGVTAGMGIPALVLYFTLISGFISMVFTSIKKVQPIARILLMGLSSGFLAHLIYGIMDNYLPGEKLGAVMWIFFGVVTAIFVHPEYLAINASGNATNGDRKVRMKFPQWTLIFVIGLLTWVLISLAAITLINTRPITSLVIAAAGGIILGLIFSGRFSKAMHASAINNIMADTGPVQV